MVGLTKLILLAANQAAGDAKKGEKVSRQFKTCHMVGGNACLKIGPVLNGVFGRKAGTYPKFKYSKINKVAGEAGVILRPELVAAYLPDPPKFLKAYLKEKH